MLIHRDSELSFETLKILGMNRCYIAVKAIYERISDQLSISIYVIRKSNKTETQNMKNKYCKSIQQGNNTNQIANRQIGLAIVEEVIE